MLAPAELAGGLSLLLLADRRGGDEGALDRLMPLVYDELRRVAQRSLSGEAGS